MQYIVFTDPITGRQARIGARNTKLEIHAEIDDIGFAGIEELNWETIETLTPQ